MKQSETTLSQFLSAETDQPQRTDPALIELIKHIASTCIRIAHLTRSSTLTGLAGSVESENIQGEQQKKMDVISNELLLDALEQCGYTAAMASEEVDDIYIVPQPSSEHTYLVAFDPLDGSSNIDINAPVGTIFSIMGHQSTGKPTHTLGQSDFMQPGKQQVAAGYCLYGPATLLVLTIGQGVHLFTLDLPSGEFLLTQQHLQIPKNTQEFAINASNQRFWEKPVQRYIDECLQGSEGPRGKDFNMRWVAAMVAEIHRILIRGGIFLYPSDSRLMAKGQEGKLRLLYEANPMSMLVEQAGGLASTGTKAIMDVQPQALHQRIPVIMGSSEEVTRLIHYHNTESV